MKNHNYILFFISVFLLFSMSCTVQNIDENTTRNNELYDREIRKVRIYFTRAKKPEELELIPVLRKVSASSSLLHSTVRELFLGPTKSEELKGIMSEIPVGTRLIGIKEDEDDIIVDISSQYLTGGGAATMQLRYLQIYKTLKTAAPFKDVYLQVDGKMLKAIGGEGLEVTQPLTKIEDYTKKYKKIESIQP